MLILSRLQDMGGPAREGIPEEAPEMGLDCALYGKRLKAAGKPDEFGRLVP